MKIAIITLFDYINIGNKLQNYAVQHLLESFGIESVTFKNIAYLSRRSPKGIYKILCGIFIKSYKRYYMDQKKKVLLKKNTQYINEKTIFNLHQIDINMYDGFLAGSDQIWHHWRKSSKGELPYYLLSWVPDYKKICFAASFGLSDIPNSDKNVYFQGLKGFCRLSCREQSGVEIIERLTGRKAELLCDPTLMLTIEEWNSFAVKPNYTIPSKYILLYFLGEVSDEVLRIINRYSDENGVFIIDIHNMNTPKYYYTTPQEFVYLVANAEYVFTDSFHGTVFSILFNRNFTVFERNKIGHEMMDRIATLLNTFSLDSHLNSLCLDSYDVSEIIEKERNKGKRYLSEELNRIRNNP